MRVMGKYRLRRWSDTPGIFCVVFLITRLNAFAQPSSNENATGMHEVTGVAVNTECWETRELPNLRIRFKLPPGYKQKQWAVVVGFPPIVATFQIGHVNQIDFAVENAEDASPESAKVIPQKDYIDYKEWSGSSADIRVLCRHFRGWCDHGWRRQSPAVLC